MTTSWARVQQHDPEEMRRHTQRDRVREILRSANDRGFCTLQFNAIGLVNGRNRVYELRDDEKLDIDTVSCDLAVYHAEELAEARARGHEVAPHVRFVWFWNKTPRQLSLLRAQ